MNGQDHIPGPVIRQSRLTGKSQHLGPHDIQRARVEHQVKKRRDIAPIPRHLPNHYRPFTAGISVYAEQVIVDDRPSA